PAVRPCLCAVLKREGFIRGALSLISAPHPIIATSPHSSCSTHTTPHTHTHLHTHTHTHTHTHIHTHIHTYTHKHTLPLTHTHFLFSCQGPIMCNVICTGRKWRKYMFVKGGIT